MGVEFSDSAARHGFAKEDAINAVNNHTAYMPEFDDSRTGGARPHLAIGPARDGREIEVMFTLAGGDAVHIFHCMEVRNKIKAYFD